jgi:ribosome maturation factor RimP
MSTLDRVRAIVEPLAAEAGLSLYDIEFNKGLLRVTVEGPPDTDLDHLARLSRTISHAFDEDDPVAGRYTLEVSSPGLERTLRRPEHFAGALGELIAVKTQPGVEGDRRFRGVLIEADADGVAVRLEPAPSESSDRESNEDEDSAVRRLAHDDIARATTVFLWGPAERPGSSPSRRKAAS